MAEATWPRRDSAKHEAERNAENESGGPKHSLFGPPDLKIRYADNVAKGVVIPARPSFVEPTGSRISPAARTAGTVAPLPPVRIPCRFRAQHQLCRDRFRVAATSRCLKRAARRALSESRS